MRTNRRWPTAAVCLLVGWSLTAAARGADFWKLILPVTEPVKASHREVPPTCPDPAVEELANQIDWLEHYIDEFGTVVAKVPEVWGESRLTQHREEFEKQMAQQLGNFQFSFQGSMARSDQAYLGYSMALQSAAAKAPAAAPTPSVVSNVLSGGLGATPRAASSIPPRPPPPRPAAAAAAPARRRATVPAPRRPRHPP